LRQYIRLPTINTQWLIGCIFNVYRCGGSVGFSPTSRLTLMDIKAPEEARILNLPWLIVKPDKDN
jgi:hypothetical protein|tara:strand:- start:6778 stop:6972 length:195 start_codon:yes stop_codon:yes gene_type:complete